MFVIRLARWEVFFNWVSDESQRAIAFGSFGQQRHCDLGDFRSAGIGGNILKNSLDPI